MRRLTALLTLFAVSTVLAVSTTVMVDTVGRDHSIEAKTLACTTYIDVYLEPDACTTAADLSIPASANEGGCYEPQAILAYLYDSWGFQLDVIILDGSGGDPHTGAFVCVDPLDDPYRVRFVAASGTIESASAYVTCSTC
jgi:hypothetical protein